MSRFAENHGAEHCLPEKDNPENGRPEDNLLRHARREAVVVAWVWFAAMVYTIGYCGMYGFHTSESQELELVFGFPAWVFWGIVVPWLVCVATGIWFSYVFMTEDELGNEPAVPGSEETTSG